MSVIRSAIPRTVLRRPHIHAAGLGAVRADCIRVRVSTRTRAQGAVARTPKVADLGDERVVDDDVCVWRDVSSGRQVVPERFALAELRSRWYILGVWECRKSTPAAMPTPSVTRCSHGSVYSVLRRSTSARLPAVPSSMISIVWGVSTTAYTARTFFLEEEGASDRARANGRSRGRTVWVAQLAQELLRGARREVSDGGWSLPSKQRRATSRTNAGFTSSLRTDLDDSRDRALSARLFHARLTPSRSGHVGGGAAPPGRNGPPPPPPPRGEVRLWNPKERFTTSSWSTLTATSVPRHVAANTDPNPPAPSGLPSVTSDALDKKAFQVAARAALCRRWWRSASAKQAARAAHPPSTPPKIPPSACGDTPAGEAEAVGAGGHASDALPLAVAASVGLLPPTEHMHAPTPADSGGLVEPSGQTEQEEAFGEAA